jgi:hypothetical protein
MPSTDPVLIARNRLAGLHVGRTPDPAAVREARQELTFAKVERSIAEALDVDPPLTTDQRSRLAALLTAGSK